MMKRFAFLTILFALAAFGLFAQEAALPRLAVVEFSTNINNEKTRADAVTVRDVVESQMVGTRKYRIITRNDIDQLLANQRIQVSSISSAENIQKLQLANINYIVTGSVNAMGNDYVVTVRVLDVSTGQFSHIDNDLMGSGSRDLYNGINTLMIRFNSGMSADEGGSIVQGPTTPAATQHTALFEMVRINGGTFVMGSPANESGRSDDEIQHRVTVSSFHMGKYPVTQEEYEAVMGTNPSNWKGYNLPVENVSWYDALVFCNRLSMREGLSPAYSINGSTDPARWGGVPTSSNATWNAVTIVAGSNGYRLPTEAQWEYACRAGTATPFSTGNNITTSQANYDGNYPYNNNARGTYRQRTTVVGSFTPNAWGLYDMHGNVSEWCWDWYGAYTTSAQTDPMGGASSNSARVWRGGSLTDVARSVRSASRNGYAPSGQNSVTGFRLVRP